MKIALITGATSVASEKPVQDDLQREVTVLFLQPAVRTSWLL